MANPHHTHIASAPAALARCMGGITLLLMYTLVWACAPAPRIMASAREPGIRRIVIAEQWLAHAHAHLASALGHFVALGAPGTSQDAGAITASEPDLSAQNSPATPLATPPARLIDHGLLRVIGDMAPHPTAADASSVLPVLRLPPRSL